MIIRNFQILKTIDDYRHLDEPVLVDRLAPPPPIEQSSMMVLRMLVRAKYSNFVIPRQLGFLWPTIAQLSVFDALKTGIQHSWCYVTIRHGMVSSKTDDEWHFDGSSFRVEIIPERNYIYASSHPTEFKTGTLEIPTDFDPLRHNLFTFASRQLRDAKVQTVKACNWYMLSPFCLHRRPTVPEGTKRTFIRICFTDIEGRDVNNTENPMLETPAFGRDPVKTFRDKLLNYYGDQTEGHDAKRRIQGT